MASSIFTKLITTVNFNMFIIPQGCPIFLSHKPSSTTLQARDAGSCLQSKLRQEECLEIKFSLGCNNEFQARVKVSKANKQITETWSCSSVDRMLAQHDPSPQFGSHKPGKMVQTCILGTWEIDEREPEVWSLPWLHRGFTDSQRCMRPCFKNKIKSRLKIIIIVVVVITGPAR